MEAKQRPNNSALQVNTSFPHAYKLRLMSARTVKLGDVYLQQRSIVATLQTIDQQQR